VAVAGTTRYQRYALAESGISPMAVPGTPGTTYTADGLEHGERGSPSSQSADHVAQLEKRQRKLTHADYGTDWADLEGVGDLAIITFGSCTGPLREALQKTPQLQDRIRVVSLRLLAPLQTVQLVAALQGVKRALVIEQNHGAQLFKYLRGECDFPCELSSFHKAGGAQFLPGELQRHILDWSRA
jgi:2-oxoglutarate ferredoxin oxidoreductase subunit alpha